MSAQMPDMVRNLKRTAINAAWTMTVDRSMVLKLIAAAELAEAEVEVCGISEYGDTRDAWIAAVQRRAIARIAYEAARSAK